MTVPDHDRAQCAGPGVCPECNQDAATAAYRGETTAGGTVEVTCPACGHRFTPSSTIRVTESAPAAEALINGERSVNDIRELLRDALTARIRAATGAEYVWVYVTDMTASAVVYAGGSDDLWQCDYQIADDGSVTLGEPTRVVPAYVPAPGGGTGEPPEPAGDMMAGAMEATETVRDRVVGRVVEAKGTDGDGGRIFRVRIIRFGDSQNRRRYTESVMSGAARLYEGARAYDHHRTAEELTSGTIAGLVGTYRGVEAVAGDGLYGDLHLLPSATHAAEALDATLAAQEAGLPALCGISHDVDATFKPITVAGQRYAEATNIVKVHSADVVATPAAGGQATRVVAGGEDPNQTDPAGAVPAGKSTKESDVTTTEDVLAALKTATPEQLAAVGMSKVSETTTQPPPAPAAEDRTQENTLGKGSFMARTMVRQKIEDAGLPASAVEAVTAALPDRVSEADVDNQIAAIKTGLGIVERAGLAPTVTAQVTKEALDKKREHLDAFFNRDYAKGYRSFREAYLDFTGRRPRSFDEDFNKVILRESLGEFDSAETRASESLDSSSWNLVLGDSITRRMVAEYSQPSLQTWQQIVSSIIPVNDFRTQRIERVGGYGTLPAVNQGAPYQPLTSPGNEEVTYAITKRGGTEDLTLEMIANDDVRAITRLPVKLGLAAAQTLYRFVWDILPTNAAVSYDSTALFHTNHNNTDNPAVLGQSTLSAGRKKMRKQTAYGDTSDVLSIVPKLLVVPSDLEEIAFQLVTSAVAIPSTPAGPSDTPNLHQGMTALVVDYYSDTNDWYLVADPAMCPTLEIGFYQGRQDPELFTQMDPTVGSMFNADKVTYKIRHIYSGAVLDHRGFYRGAN